MTEVLTNPVSTAFSVLKGWDADVQVLDTSEFHGPLLRAVLGDYQLLVAQAFVGQPQISDEICVARAAEHLHSVTCLHYANLSLLWFTVGGPAAEAHAQKIVELLYGSARIFDKRSKVMKPCYFFGEPAFGNPTLEIDGAMIVREGDAAVSMQLCLNTWSRRWRVLRDSPYATQKGLRITDPEAEEARAAAYLVGADAPRGDAATMLRYVEDKYELERAMNMDTNIASAASPPAG